MGLRYAFYICLSWCDLSILSSTEAEHHAPDSLVLLLCRSARILMTPVRHLVSLYTHSAAFPATWLEIGISSLHLLPYGLMLRQTPLADMADVNPQIRKSAFTTVYSQK